jgi:predicted phage terminase large subunit-like protein
MSPAQEKMKTATLTNDVIAQKIRLRKLKAVEHHLNFMAYTWRNLTEAFVVGYHTKMICAYIDDAINKFRKGISSFLVVTLPVRHGKSEIISRKLPAHFLGLFPDCKVILCGHTAGLTEDYSKISRDLISTKEFQDLFSGVNVDPMSSSASHWKIKDREGECFASGILGSLTGQGYHLGILDDYCRGREDAESEITREKTWNAFTNDFMTRKAPVSITIVLATRWHTDDVIGRMEEKTKTDPSFPKVKIIKMPAFSNDYPTGYLFPERYSPQWYEELKAALGIYGTASLLQQTPIIHGGDLLKTDKIHTHYDVAEFPEITFTRVWDYAHTEKQRMKDDPDFTSGTLLAFNEVDGQKHLWVKNVERFQYAAPERDKRIRQIVDADGPYVRLAVENTIDSKDAVAQMRKVLSGIKEVIDATGTGDKVLRATPLEAIFAAGNVHILYGGWNQDWIKEVGEFPRGKHDDQVDNLSAGYKVYTEDNGSSVGSSRIVF